MTEHPDVLILGGGVIGLSTAWFLAEAGARHYYSGTKEAHKENHG